MCVCVSLGSPPRIAVLTVGYKGLFSIVKNKIKSKSKVNLKNVTSISSKHEPGIWSRDTGQRISCFDRCQLTIAWMSNIKEVRNKPRVHVSLARLRRLHRRAYAPTSNNASHEKINLWVSLTFIYVDMGLRGAALPAA